jgi:hypothetical protein
MEGPDLPGSDEGERELLLKERESLLLTPHE